ncbi:MAG: chromate transporter [Clostridia bacterium]|nr:chromate transporter [Clostridia bacterium]
MKRDKRLYRELFFSTLKLSACTFGGGYVIVPLMRKRFVEDFHWIDEREMLDLVSLSQSSPGPIAVNASLMIGYRIGGVAGALVTALGTVLPPLAIISVISMLYSQFRDNAFVSAAMRGMQAGVAAVICNVVVDMGRDVLKSDSGLSACLMTGVFTAVFFFKVNVLWVILACAGTGLIFGMIRARRAARGLGKIGSYAAHGTRP